MVREVRFLRTRPAYGHCFARFMKTQMETNGKRPQPRITRVKFLDLAWLGSALLGLSRPANAIRWSFRFYGAAERESEERPGRPFENMPISR